jgi:hypothetical protein
MNKKEMVGNKFKNNSSYDDKLFINYPQKVE